MQAPTDGVLSRDNRRNRLTRVDREALRAARRLADAPRRARAADVFYDLADIPPGKRITDTEGNVAGLVLLGRKLHTVRIWWDTAQDHKRHCRFADAEEIYDRMVTRLTIEARFPMSQTAIGLELGMTQGRVGQLIGQVIQKLDSPEKPVTSVEDLRTLCADGLGQEARRLAWLNAEGGLYLVED